MKAITSLCFSLFTLVLLCSAQNNTTSPNCLAASCSELQNTALKQCGFDFKQRATNEQTACVCSVQGIDTLLNKCIECIRSMKNSASIADSYASTCKDYRVPPSSKSNSTTSTQSSIRSSTQSSSSSTTATVGTTTPSSPASKTSQAPTASSTGTGVGNSNTPGIALAVVLLVVQAGL